jgi:ketosteroid isomerase-like protein
MQEGKMKKIILVLVVPVFLLSFCDQKTPEVNLNHEKDAVKIILDNYVKSVIDEDMDFYAKQVSQDSHMVNVGGGISLSWIEGWEALKKVMDGQNQAFANTEIKIKQEKIFVSTTGQTAWAVNQWDLKTNIRGKPYSLPLRCSWVLEKQNQNWVIVHFHKSFGVKSLKNYKITEKTSGEQGSEE